MKIIRLILLTILFIGMVNCGFLILEDSQAAREAGAFCISFFGLAFFALLFSPVKPKNV